MMKGLVPGTTYDVAVSATTPDGLTTATSPSISLAMPNMNAGNLLSATADTPTTSIVAIGPPTAGPLPISYTVTLIPVAGGTPITVTTTTPVADFSGLQPGAAYTATAASTMSDGKTVPVPGSLPVKTPPSYNAPALTSTAPTSPTTGMVTIDLPNTPVQPTSYTVTLTPVGGGSTVKVTCTNPNNCPVNGLTPNTTYSVTAVGNLPGGGSMAASGISSLVTPDGSPKITNTISTSPFSGTVTITPAPSGPQPTNYTLTLTPVDGGSPITVTCSTPSRCPVTGLDPGTTYLVSLPGRLAAAVGVC